MGRICGLFPFRGSDFAAGEDGGIDEARAALAREPNSGLIVAID